MDKLVEFFKNVWFRRAVALVCWGYTFMMAWVAWLSFGYSFEYDNPTALGLMILTRRQVITMVNCMILPPIIFVIVIFGFGNWYLILPPLAVVIAMFFINAANETLKTVLGTIYLLMYVIGVVAYIAINLFMGDLTFFIGVDLSRRDADYEKLSPSGDYRIVRYVDEPGERRTAAYYIESTEDDVKIPFGICKKVFGSKHIHTAAYQSKSDDPVSWKTVREDGEEIEALDVEGSTRENPYLIKAIDGEEEIDPLSTAVITLPQPTDEGSTETVTDTAA